MSSWMRAVTCCWLPTSYDHDCGIIQLPRSSRRQCTAIISFTPSSYYLYMQVLATPCQLLPWQLQHLISTFVAKSWVISATADWHFLLLTLRRTANLSDLVAQSSFVTYIEISQVGADTCEIICEIIQICCTIRCQPIAWNLDRKAKDAGVSHTFSCSDDPEGRRTNCFFFFEKKYYVSTSTLQPI